MFRQGGLERREQLYRQGGVGAEVGEAANDLALRDDVPLALGDVVAKHFDLLGPIHVAPYT